MAKKKTKEPVKVSQPTNKIPSQSDKHYIWENATSKTPTQLSQDTGLTEGQVNAILVSTDIDVEPVVEESEKKARQVRRFLVDNGSISMTPGQANLDNLVHEQNLQNKRLNEFEKKHGKCVEFRPLSK